ncbi:hypothetical protein IAU59_005791 [Kwoniella sp. CBS 9459]
MAPTQVAKKACGVPCAVRQAVFSSGSEAPQKTKMAAVKGNKGKSTHTGTAKTSAESKTSNLDEKKGKKRARSASPSQPSTIVPVAGSKHPLTAEGSTQTQTSLDKQLVLAIIVAKLEASKECDWHALSQTIGDRIKATSSPSSASASGGKKGKQGTGAGGGEGKMSGTELYELYHTTILPSLKNGKALWTDTNADAIMSDDLAIPQTPVSMKNAASPSGTSSASKIAHGTQKTAVSKEGQEEKEEGEEDEGDEAMKGYPFDSEEEYQVVKTPRVERPKVSATPGSNEDKTTAKDTLAAKGEPRSRGGIKTYQKKRKARTPAKDQSDDNEDTNQSGSELISDGESVYAP